MKWRPAGAFWSFFAAFLIHAGLLSWLFAAEPPQTKPSARPPVRVRLATRKPPPMPVSLPVPEAPPAKVATSKPAALPPKAPPKKVAPVKSSPPKAAENSAPEPVTAPPVEPNAPAVASEPSRPVRKFTVALEATVSGGKVAVPVSESGSGFAFGAPDGDPRAEPRLPPARAPAEGRTTASAERTYEVTEITRPPRPVAQPSVEELRALYPKEARERGIEGNVSLRLRVSKNGEVVEVRLVQGAGYGFDEVAKTLARRLRFTPAERAGEPVEVWIPWTFRFRLEN